jgi:hypothetical protein
MLSPEEIARIRIKAAIKHLENMRDTCWDTGVQKIIEELIEERKKELVTQTNSIPTPPKDKHKC